MSYGSIIVLEENVSRNNKGRLCNLFRCFCGEEFISEKSAVIHGRKKSCGCHLNSKNIKLKFDNPLSYESWRSMLGRCYHKSNKEYERYHGKGIEVCTEWRYSFKQFVKDMGERPNRLLTLDRINNDKNYYKDNCRWASRETQMQNRGIQKNNKTGYPGVVKINNKFKIVYTAQVKVKGKMVRLGNSSCKHKCAMLVDMFKEKRNILPYRR